MLIIKNIRYKMAAYSNVHIKITTLFPLVFVFQNIFCLFEIGTVRDGTASNRNATHITFIKRDMESVCERERRKSESQNTIILVNPPFCVL